MSMISNAPPGSNALSQNIDTVRRMLATWDALDVEAMLATMTPDARYHNIPLPVLVGHDAIREWTNNFLKDVTTARIETLAEAEGPDGIVMNERIDYFTYTSGKSVAIRLMGVFRFRGGLICDWRDYLDLAEFTAQLK